MSKKLADVKDENGTSLQSFAELLAQKADRADVRFIALFVIPDDGVVEGASLHTIGNVDMAVIPDFLSQLASQMRKQAKGKTTHARETVQ